jgi:gas vesicle protein
MVAALVGAAVGAGVALLYAPQSGRETRNWLAQRGRALKQQAGSAIEQGRSAVRRAVSEIGTLTENDSYDRAALSERATKSNS